MQIDMRSGKEDGYDAITVSPHKFTGGPGAPGILLMRKSLYRLGKRPPSTCGGGTVAYVNGFNEEDTLYHDNIEEREQGGTPPILGNIRCALAFWVKESMGTTFIKQREDMYMKQAIRNLSSHTNVKILGDNKHDKGATLLGKPLDGSFVVKLLNDLFGIQARGGCACAGPYGHLLLDVNAELSLEIRDAILKGYNGLKPGWTRLSLCYTMSDEEVEYILSAIGFLARFGHRFLSLYDFDWHTGNWKFSHERFTCVVSCKKTNNQCNKLMQVTIPVSKEKYSERERFRHYLDAAKALCYFLPSSPLPRRPPADIDSSLVFFRV
ncbi:hypothetical protein KP509_39G004500 [Ceratopteris richardii]|uniref:Aminotransferase class V domain-containing protein n=1 Tax=Ceratopteris richardii TaxID=49495 RepID=A0A8T2PY53_CERRI|nr:hypothetical protein KP509_39G004500 [Ceratopteris richardii]